MSFLVEITEASIVYLILLAVNALCVLAAFLLHAISFPRVVGDQPLPLFRFRWFIQQTQFL